MQQRNRSLTMLIGVLFITMLTAIAGLAQGTGRSIRLNSITIFDEDDPLSNDEPYLIVTQFKLRLEYGPGGNFVAAPGTLEVGNIMAGHNNLDGRGENWADEDHTYNFGPHFAGAIVPRGEPFWVIGAVVIHMEKDGFSASTADLISSQVEASVERALSSMSIGVPSFAGITEAVTRQVSAQFSCALRRLDLGGIVRGIASAVDPDDFGGIGLVMLITGPGDRVFMFAGTPPANLATGLGGVREVKGTTDFSLDFPAGDLSGIPSKGRFQGHHRVQGRAPLLKVADWAQTSAGGMGDVAVGPDGKVWLAGRNGTVWFSNDGGASFNHLEAGGFDSLAVGSDGTVWAVGFNGTLWKFSSGRWTATSASGMGDVAVGPDGKIWLAGRNGTIWFSNDGGASFNQIEASGFARVAVRSDGTLWAVGANGTLWKFSDGIWAATSASGMGDVAIGPDGKIWLTGQDGTLWFSNDGVDFTQVEASGFRRVAVGADSTVWAVGFNGTLWKFSGAH